LHRGVGLVLFAVAGIPVGDFALNVLLSLDCGATAHRRSPFLLVRRTFGATIGC
jgi:hypothetical protein